jgi:hypothetical protein
MRMPSPQPLYEFFCPQGNPYIEGDYRKPP